MAPIPLLLFVPLADLLMRAFAGAGRARGALAVAGLGLAFHGVFTANQGMEPLYRGDHRASLKAAAALAAEGRCPPLIVPDGVVAACAPEEAALYGDLPTIDLVGAGREPTAPERMLFDARGMGLVVPKSRFSFMTQMRMFHAVRPLEYGAYLDAHARAIPLYAAPPPLDRLLLRVSPRRLSEPKVVGHVYVLPN